MTGGASSSDTRAKPPTTVRDKSKKSRTTASPKRMNANNKGEEKTARNDSVLEETTDIEPRQLALQFDIPDVSDKTFWTSEIQVPTKHWREWKKQAKTLKPFQQNGTE